MDEPHFWAAVRYVELNPVNAGLASQAEHYPWSSAAAHCGLRTDPLLTRDPHWCRLISGVSDWSQWLTRSVDAEALDSLRKNTRKGLPAGSPDFIRAIELETGRILARRPRGRPRKPEDDSTAQHQSAQHKLLLDES